MLGELFTPEYIEDMIQESNAYYVATNINVTNVAFVHGSLTLPLDDPWHALGCLTDVNEHSPAFIIEGKFLGHFFILKYVQGNLYGDIVIWVVAALDYRSIDPWQLACYDRFIIEGKFYSPEVYLPGGSRETPGIWQIS